MISRAFTMTSYKIADDYLVNFNEIIGKGATGKVYVAVKKTNESQKVAVKVIDNKRINPELVESITNEIRTLRLLNHPHIVKLYDIYEESSQFYLVMELVGGGELFDRITEKTYYNESDAKSACRCILSAIKHCHDMNIVHRDLKPENLMMASKEDDADVKLVSVPHITTRILFYSYTLYIILIG